MVKPLESNFKITTVREFSKVETQTQTEINSFITVRKQNAGEKRSHNHSKIITKL